jgi:hypothetical protein
MHQALGFLEDAVDATPNIPEAMSANVAANEILEFLYDTPKKSDPNAWFMRH